MKLSPNPETFYLDQFYTNLGIGILAIDYNMSIRYMNPWVQKRLPETLKNAQNLVEFYDGQSMDFLKSAILDTIHYKTSRMISQMLHSWIIPLPDNRFPDHKMRQGAQITPLIWANSGETLAILQIRDESDKVLHIKKLKETNLTLEEQIKERQLAQEAAEIANRAKSQFLASMSHEIRTPLNAILGMAELLGETETSQEQKDYLASISRASDTLIMLINDILDLSKIEADQLKLDHELFDLEILIEGTCEMMALSAHKKGIELVTTFDPTLPFSLVGDANRVRQILVNLLNNAIKFTDAGSILLNVSLISPIESNRGMIEFKLRDSGIGISEEKIPLIFHNFIQADSSTTRKYGGTGLGLAICKRLTHLMGGTIQAESQLNQGSVFTVHIPFDFVPNAPENQRLQETPLQGQRALVVDDSPENCSLVAQYLTRWGASTTEKNSGKECLSEIQSAIQSGASYDVLILDSDMPKMDGFSVIEQLRKTAELPPFPLLMLDRDHHKIDVQQCLELEVPNYLFKPIKRKVLLNLLKRQLQTEPPPDSAGLNQIEDLGLPPLKILIAEDSIDNQIVIRKYLEKIQATVDLVENGEKAVQYFIQQPYDLVLMDMQMPVMDGYTAMRKIREWEREKNKIPIPIIALTAYALKDDSQKSLDAGATLYLTKPLKKWDLFKGIAYVLQHKAAATHTVPPSEPPANQEGYLVVVDDDFKEVMPQIIQSKKEQLQDLQSALKQEDRKTIKFLGHKLRGMHGIEKLNDLGLEIEYNALQGEFEVLQNLVDTIDDFLEHIEIRYE